MADLISQRQLGILHDRQGRTFELWTPYHERTTQLERLNVYYEDVRVGYANLTHQADGRMHLADIHLDEEVRLRAKTLLDLFRQLFGRPRMLRPRGNHLGGALLAYILSYAKEMGYTEVYGEIAELDYAPYLLAWYERHGFTVRAEREGSRWMAHISKELS